MPSLPAPACAPALENPPPAPRSPTECSRGPFLWATDPPTPVCPIQGWLCRLGGHRRRKGIPSNGRDTRAHLEDGQAGRTKVGRLGVGGRCRGAAPRGSCPAVRGRGSQAPGRAVSSGPLLPWLLLQEAAAWAAVSVLGGGRVAAGRGLDQECVSRNVAALPAEGGVGDGAGGLGSP